MNQSKRAFITFGQTHTHSVSGQTIDKDTVVVIQAETEQKAVDICEETFGRVYCGFYYEDSWNEEENLPYYPKGYVYI